MQPESDVIALECLVQRAETENEKVQELSASAVSLNTRMHTLRSSLENIAQRTPELQAAKQTFVAARNFKASEHGSVAEISLNY